MKELRRENAASELESSRKEEKPLNITWSESAFTELTEEKHYSQL